VQRRRSTEQVMDVIGIAINVNARFLSRVELRREKCVSGCLAEQALLIYSRYEPVNPLFHLTDRFTKFSGNVSKYRNRVFQINCFSGTEVSRHQVVSGNSVQMRPFNMNTRIGNETLESRQ
jgi:hypothetical protein